MALLPRKVGSVTLMRALGSDGVTESFVGILDQPAGKQVIVRKVLPSFARDEARLSALRARVGDLLPVRHVALLPVLDAFEVPEDGSGSGGLHIVQEWVDSVSLADVARWCNERDEALPHNVFLHLAVQICNGLEALHSRPGASSGTRHVLHLCVRPESILLTRDGELLLGDHGLVRSPTLAPHSGGIRLKTAYLSPEQTHQDEALTPASDLFCLGAVLYEMLVHRAMFQDSTPLRTIARVRRAEVTTQLLEVKEILPGVDRVLYRALALSPRHRYQRAFVMREDLRALMAGYSFSDIEGECRQFLEPLFQGRTRAIDELTPPVASPSKEATQAQLEDTLTGVRLLGFPARPDDGAANPIPPDDDTAPTGEFDLPPAAGPLDRPVNYAHDPVPEASWTGPMGVPEPETDERSWPDVTRAALEEHVPGPFGAVADSSEELELLPRAPLVPPAPQPVEPSIDEPSVAVPMVFGAVGAGFGAMFIVLCAGFTLVGAIGATRMSRAEPDAVIARADVLDETQPMEARLLPDPPARAAPEPPSDPPELITRRGNPGRSDADPRDVRARDARPRSPVRDDAVALAMVPAPRDPTLVDADWDVDMLVAEDLSPLSLTAPPPPLTVEQAPPVVAAEPAPRAVTVEQAPRAVAVPEDLGALAAAAFAGQLDDGASAGLAAVVASDPRFTRARVLLYQDAKARGDHAARTRWMDELMQMEENRWRPELLVEQAALEMADRDWRSALELANRAEQHWSRLPRELVFTRKAMIHEIQAGASYALYAAGDPPDEAWLDGAVDAWTRYRTHASGAGRDDLRARADAKLAQLQDVRRRMH
jgi:serine/threonine protein kinase